MARLYLVWTDLDSMANLFEVPENYQGKVVSIANLSLELHDGQYSEEQRNILLEIGDLIESRDEAVRWKRIDTTRPVDIYGSIVFAGD